MVTAGSEVSWAGATDLSGGLRLWGGFLDRMTVLGEGSKTEKGRYAPSLTVAVRVLGDRRANWGIGILGRYRTEGFSTIDGEVEAGFLGSYVKSGLHLDAGVLAGKGLEEEEADAEVLARFGYDVFPVLRLGLEGRVRHELGKEPAAATTGGDTGEWDALAGAQASVAYDHFFLTLTLGSQKPRLSEQLGFVGHVVVGGVAF